jgi:hypothetical protein
MCSDLSTAQKDSSGRHGPDHLPSWRPLSLLNPLKLDWLEMKYNPRAGKNIVAVIGRPEVKALRPVR